MKKLLFVLISISLIFSSCSNIQEKEKVLRGDNVVGNWGHKISNRMGGYMISQSNTLTIIRNGPGDYEYELKTTSTDQMYGGIPKTEYSGGHIGECTYIDENSYRWEFNGGTFGERGGYISVPSDLWFNYKPESITVKFGYNRGNPMVFY